MDKYKYITTTLPYINSVPHIGHCFEFVLADVIAEYHRFDKNVFFNVGIDEHGQKIYQKSIELGYTDTQAYCDVLSDKWKSFCSLLKINYDNFYRTTDSKHKQQVLRYYNEIKQHVYVKEYEGLYCSGCEAYITEKELGDNKGICPIHKTELVKTNETNRFFNLKSFSDIDDILVDKNRSLELLNIINDNFDLSITRQNVDWGISTGDDTDNSVFYVWFEALLNYIFAIGYYGDNDYFSKYWSDSLIICGKDNLKFQAYILQALLVANNIPQTSGVLVHGNILDVNGKKLSKTVGNVIDPVEQVEKYGLDAIRYYLIFGLNVFADSKYSEDDLVRKWNNDIVKGLGNLISRLLHLIDIRSVELDNNIISEESLNRIIESESKIRSYFESYDLRELGVFLNDIVFNLNKRITIDKPFDKDCDNYSIILNEIYAELYVLIKYYGIVLKEHKDLLDAAFINNKKVIIFKTID